MCIRDRPLIAISSIFISGALTGVSTGLAVASESAIFMAPWADNINTFISWGEELGVILDGNNSEPIILRTPNGEHWEGEAEMQIGRAHV